MKSTVIDKWTWKRNGPKSTECSNSSSKRGIYSDTVKLQETRKIWNKQPKLILEELGGKKQRPKSVKAGNNKAQNGNKWNRD